MPSKIWDEIYYPFQNFNDATGDVWEWTRNFIPHFIMNMITYPRWGMMNNVPEMRAAVTIHIRSKQELGVYWIIPSISNIQT